MRQGANPRGGFVKEGEEQSKQNSRANNARFCSQLKKIILRLNVEAHDVKRAIHRKHFGKGSETGPQNGKVFEDREGVDPTYPSPGDELFRCIEKSAHDKVETDPSCPEESQAENRDRGS